MKASNLQIIKQLTFFFRQAEAEKLRYCQRVQDFTRNRLISFHTVIYFILNLSKRSLSLELADYFEHFHPTNEPATKSAFSQARYKIKAQLFQDCNHYLIQQAQTHQFFTQTWLGLQLIGVDGTTITLPDTACIRTEFGTVTNQNKSSQVPMAQVVCAYDVLNRVGVLSKIAPIATSETCIAMEFVKQLPDLSLSIYDRGYTGFAFIYQLTSAGKPFLMRAKLGFNNQVKAFVKSSKWSKVVTFSATDRAIKTCQALGIVINKKATVKVRLVKVLLDTGQLEVLVSSLIDSAQYPTNCFKELYFYRWGVEVFFDQLKNIIQLESFIGHKPEAIYQEFYAMVLLCNLYALIITEAEQQLQARNCSKKYDYSINNNIAIGLIKYRLIELLIDCSRQRWESLQNKLLKHTEPVRPNRKNNRVKKRAKRGKYHTLTNYRRAI